MRARVIPPQKVLPYNAMLRKIVNPKTAAPQGFRLRGHEIRRIETFSDAVFAFAVTLLIVSLEVPRSFEELLVSMRGFIPFAICFTLLILIWYEQNSFFRRYGLNDPTTIILNSILLFIVLFFVYPLKFLFTLIFSDSIYGAGHSPLTISSEQILKLMLIYSFGYIIIYSIFLLMYIHALRQKAALELTTVEIFDTRTKIHAQLILISIGFLAIVLNLLLPVSIAGVSGFAYFAIGPSFWIYHSRRRKKRKHISHN